MTLTRTTLVALVAAEAANVVGLLELHGVRRALLALIAAGAVVAVLGLRRGELHPDRSPVVLALAAYATALVLTTLRSPDPAAGTEVVVGAAVDLAWFAVVLTLLCAPGAPALAAATFVAVLAGLSLLGVLQELVLGNDVTFGGLAGVPLATDLGSVTPRHSGPQLDVNFWGRVLVLGVPLAASLWAGRLGGRSTAWAGCGALVVAGIYLTQSRGALLALAAGVLVWPVLAGQPHRRLLRGLPVLLVLALVVPGVGSRLASVVPVSPTAAVLAQPDPSVEGRRDAQVTAVRVFADHPLTGVGPGRFERVTPDYQRQSQSRTGEVLAPHNLYLQLAAEGGIVLLAAWTVLLLTAALVAARAQLLLRRTRPAEALLGAGVLAALVAWSVSSLFLHLATQRTFLLIVALGTALDLAARSTRGASGPADVAAAPAA